MQTRFFTPVALFLATLVASTSAASDGAPTESTSPSAPAPAPVPVSAHPKSPIFPAFSAKNALVEEGLTDEQMAEIENGEVVVMSRPVPKGRKGIHVAAAALVEGTTEEVFSVVMDCDGQPTFTPHLEICRNTYAPGVEPATAAQYEQYQKLKLGFGFISKEIEYTNVMFAKRPYVSGWVLKEKGDVEESEGYWRVIPLAEEKQLLIYDVYNRPGMSVPNWVQEILTKSDLPNTVDAFRKRVAEIRAPKK